MKNKILASILCASLLAGFTGCSGQNNETSVVSVTEVQEQNETVPETEQTEQSETSEEPENFIYYSYFEEYDFFEVTSSDLVDGVWSDVISNTHIGTNESPELSWEPVEGATEYAVFMVDANSNGFLHWKSSGITETTLPEGWAPKLLEYNGPHVGHGYTHIYDIYVIALRGPVNELRGGINAVNPKIGEFMESLDTDADGNTGNIVAVGKISGTFTDARFRETGKPDAPYTM